MALGCRDWAAAKAKTAADRQRIVAHKPGTTIRSRRWFSRHTLDDSTNVVEHLALYVGQAVDSIIEANIIYRHPSSVMKISDVASGSPLPGVTPAPSNSIFRSQHARHSEVVAN